jgi:hypothetical protein
MDSSVGGITGKAVAKPHSDHFAALAPFLSADFHFESMIANLPGAAPLKGHESRLLIVVMEAIHGYLPVSVDDVNHRQIT